MNSDFLAWRSKQHKAVTARLRQVLPKGSSMLAQAMRYATLRPSKQLRPLLCLAAASCCGTARGALHAACAVELVHCYSLAHDDLPCMDDDLLRSGQPSCHAKFGEAAALLAGDGLQVLAFAELAKARLGERALSLLAEAIGHGGMVGGQADDLAGAARSLLSLRRMHARKSGSLMAAAAQLGALAASAGTAQQKRLQKFGTEFGVLFQIADDILDATASADKTGKTPGQDRRRDRATYVTVLGLAKAKQQLLASRRKVSALLGKFPGSPELLAQLCDWAVPELA